MARKKHCSSGLAPLLKSVESLGTYEDELPSENGEVEGRDLARVLAIVTRQAEVRDDTQDHKADGERNADAHDDKVWSSSQRDAVVIEAAERGAPVPKSADIDLLNSLDGARSDDPFTNRGTTYVHRC
jgi:hypothetical protein